MKKILMCFMLSILLMITTVPVYSTDKSTEMGSLTVVVESSEKDGVVTPLLKAQLVEEGYKYYYELSVDDKSAAQPAFDSVYNGTTELTADTFLTGCGENKYVQVIKVDAVERKVIAWGQASIEEAMSLKDLEEIDVEPNNGMSEESSGFSKTTISNFSMNKSTEMGSLTVVVESSEKDGVVTPLLKAQLVEEGYKYYYELSVDDKSAAQPAFDSVYNGTTELTADTLLTGYGNNKYVQVIKVEAVESKVIAWGQASIEEALKPKVLENIEIQFRNGVDEDGDSLLFLDLPEIDSGYSYLYKVSQNDETINKPIYDSILDDGYDWEVYVVDEPVYTSISEEFIQVVKINSTTNKVKAWGQKKLASPIGYITDSSSLMAYKLTTTSFDIIGKFDEKWKATTYHNNGYNTYIKDEQDELYQLDASGDETKISTTDITSAINLDIVNEGKLIKITYTIKNKGTTDFKYALGSAADVQIGKDDKAKITPFDGNTGFKMISSADEDKNAAEEYAQFNFFGKNVTGVTSVTDYWYGKYSGYDNYNEDWAFLPNSKIEIDKNGNSAGSKYDAAMGYSWQNQTIAAGETKTYSILIGIGGANSEEIVIPTPKPTNPPVVEDKPTPIPTPTPTTTPKPTIKPTPKPTLTPTPSPIVEENKSHAEIVMNDGAPKTKINNDITELEKIVFSQAEIELIQNGSDAKIFLEITDIENTINEEDKKKIEETLGEETVGIYLDISLFKQLDNEDPVKVTNPNGKVKVSIQIPETMIQGEDDAPRTYKIVRVHDGKVDIIEGIYDPVTNEFTFETELFSTYALIYVENKVETKQNNTYLYLLLGVVVLGSAGIIVYNKKKKAL
ncbi:hypothetical protein [Anaerorhabdus sp.]|uniref:hypothetical protein n=1 Tax=Anaerorhabdus sp. TaxID=1872524 RepID=UPI002FC88069